MTALRFVWTFVATLVLATAAIVTATFLVWALLEAQPGTAAALGMLFLLAPALGLAIALMAAINAVRAGRASPTGPRNRVPSAAFWAMTGGLGGYGLAILVLSLTDPANLDAQARPDAWRGWAPLMTAVALGTLFGLRALRRR